MKNCYNCKHYCSLVNYGYWWCDLNLDMTTDECDMFDETPKSTTYTTYTLDSNSLKENKSTTKEYGIWLLNHKNKK